MLIFGKLVDEIQMGNTCDHAIRYIASKLSIFLPLRAIYFGSYQYETPCSITPTLHPALMKMSVFSWKQPRVSSFLNLDLIGKLSTFFNIKMHCKRVQHNLHQEIKLVKCKICKGKSKNEIQFLCKSISRYTKFESLNQHQFHHS